MGKYLLFCILLVFKTALAICGQIIDELPDEIQGQVVDHNEDVWYYFQGDKGVVRQHAGTLELFTSRNSELASNFVETMFVDNERGVWCIHHWAGEDNGYSNGMSRFDGDAWSPYMRSYSIYGHLIMKDEVWVLTSHAYTDDFSVSRYREGGFHSWLLIKGHRPYSWDIRHENGIIECDINGVTYGFDGSKWTISDEVDLSVSEQDIGDDSWFPLTAGSQWTYLRTFYFEEVFIPEDYSVVSPIVVDTLTVKVLGNYGAWTVFLDGRMFRTDDDGNIYRLGYGSILNSDPLFIVTTCNGDSCNPWRYIEEENTYVYRNQDTIVTPAGYFDQYVFDYYQENSKHSGVYGISHGIGLVYYSYETGKRYYDYSDYVKTITTWKLISADIIKKPAFIEEDQPHPALLSITGAYPNPFNSSVTIAYVLQSLDDIHIDIYNLSGQKVYQKNINLGSPGINSFTWNGHDTFEKPISSGIYIIRLSSNTLASTVKTLYLK